MNFFYKKSKFKKKYKYFFSGGGGEEGRGWVGARVSEFCLLRIQIEKKNRMGVWGMGLE